MESSGDEPGSALFACIRKSVSERGVDIRLNLNGNTLRLDFADGQRILVNFDARTNKVWLAARSGGIEFSQRGGTWRARNQSELFARLHELIELAILSNPINARTPAPQTIQAVRPDPLFLPTRKNRDPRKVLFILLAIVSVFWAASGLNHPQLTPGIGSSERAMPLGKSGYPCESVLPANGSVTWFSPAGLRPDNQNDPEIILRNDHTHPLLLILSVPNTAPLLSVLVRGGARYYHAPAAGIV